MKINDLKKHKKCAFKFENIQDYNNFIRECERLNIRWVSGDKAGNWGEYRCDKYYFLGYEGEHRGFRLTRSSSMNLLLPLYSGFCKIENIE